MSNNESDNWAKMIGRGLAHVQNGIDHVADEGFKVLKNTGSKKIPKKKEDENKYVYAAKRFGLGVTKFLGTLGDEYYKKYGDLKKKN